MSVSISYMDPYQEIKKLLSGIEYDLMEHEHVVTSQDAARVRGLSINEGMKSLLLTAGDSLILIVLRGDSKLHTKKLRQHLNTRDIRFASPNQVLKTMGVEVGACYPFGDVAGVPMLVDNGFETGSNQFVSFNPGLHTQTIRMRWDDYKKVVKPELVDIVKTT